jgi:hypothetical protein
VPAKRVGSTALPGHQGFGSPILRQHSCPCSLGERVGSQRSRSPGVRIPNPPPAFVPVLAWRASRVSALPGTGATSLSSAALLGPRASRPRTVAVPETVRNREAPRHRRS